MVRKSILTIIFDLISVNKKFSLKNPYFTIFFEYKKGGNYYSIDFQNSDVKFLSFNICISYFKA